MCITSIRIHQPQINVPALEPALDVGNVFSIWRPHRHANRDLRIVLEGDLTILLGFEIQYPEIAVAAAVAYIYEFTICWSSRWSLHCSSLVRDLHPAPNIVLRIASDGVAPNVELDLPSGCDYIAAAINVW